MHITPSLPTLATQPSSPSSTAASAQSGGGLCAARPRKRRATLATWMMGTLLLSLGCSAEPGDSPNLDPVLPATDSRGPAACADSGAMSSTGMNVIGGDIVMLPSCKKGTTPGWAVGANGRHVLFANFEGIDVRPGDNALENEALRNMDLYSKGVIELDAFDPDNPKRYDAILGIQKQVAAWYQDVNVDVVISRPLTGDYLMTAVGGRQSDIVQMDGVVGISPGDCKNNNEANLNYAFSGSLNQNAEQVAVTIAHEAGHAYGLGHTQNNKDIMFPSVSKVDGFLEGAAADPGPCGFKNGDRQDSKQVLIQNLGARSGPRPGSDVPTVNVLEPKDGSDVGKELTIAVKASANSGIDHVTLSLSRIEGGKSRGGHPVAELRPPQSSASVRISTAGSYQLTATAYDKIGNVALSQARFTVATPTCKVPNDCAPGQRCESNVCMTPPLPPPPAMPPAGMMADSNLRAYGTACDKSSDCKGGLCAITAVGQICTHYCTPERLCAGGLECVDGTCLPQIYPRSTPKIGQLGGKCTRNQDCVTGECSAAGDISTPRYCTKTCDPKVAWTCPATMECVMSDGPSGSKERCVAKPVGLASDPAGGCSMAPAHGSSDSTVEDSREYARKAAGAAMMLLLGGLYLIGRRRRIDPAL